MSGVTQPIGFPVNNPSFQAAGVAVLANPTATYTAKPNDFMILCDVSAYAGAGPNITLAPPVEYFPVMVRNVAGSAATHAITVTAPAGCTIEDPNAPGTFAASVTSTVANFVGKWAFDRARTRFVLFPPAGGTGGGGTGGTLSFQALNAGAVPFNDTTLRTVVSVGPVTVLAGGQILTRVEIPYTCTAVSASAVNFGITVDGVAAENITLDLPSPGRGNFAWMGVLTGVAPGLHSFTATCQGGGSGTPPTGGATSPTPLTGGASTSRIIVTPL